MRCWAILTLKSPAYRLGLANHIIFRINTLRQGVLQLSFPFIPSVYIFRSSKLDNEQNFEIEVGGLGGKPFISMMKTANLWKRDDFPVSRQTPPVIWAILFQREMRSA